MKNIRNLLCIVLTILLLVTSVQGAMAENNISVILDGQQIQFDVMPQLINNRTMVPLRAIFEAFGATVAWDDSTRTVTAVKESTTMKLTVDNINMQVNNEVIPMDTPACIIDGRVLVPVRAISDALGVKVKWEESIKSVLLSTTDEFIEPVVTMYSLDGRTQLVPQSQVEANKSVGWYTAPVTILYALDGRTEVVFVSDVPAWQSVGWYTAPVTTIYSPGGGSAVVCTSDVEAYLSQGWSTSPILSKAEFLNKVNGWWVDLSTCRLLWDDAYGLDFMYFNSDDFMVGSTYSEFWDYKLNKLTYKGNNTYDALIYMPGYWYGDEYFNPEYINSTIIYDGGDSFSISYNGGKWFTYTFVGLYHDFDSIQKHPLVINAAN